MKNQSTLAIAAFAAFTAASSVSAARIVVPPMPMSPFADTEVTTNICFRANGGRARKVEVTFILPGGCASNCLQVAFGRDADGDGVLAFGETEAVFSWRNGRSFAENVAEGVRIEEEMPCGDGPCSFAIGFSLGNGHGLRNFSATNAAGAAVLSGLSASAQSGFCRSGWNLARVTRRGGGIPAEWLYCETSPDFFAVRFK